MTTSSLATATAALAALLLCSCDAEKEEEVRSPPLCGKFAVGSDAPTTAGNGFRDPEKMTGPPRGGGLSAGSTDVYSFSDGQVVTLRLACPIIDGPGPDFVIFENPFMVDGCDGPSCTFTEVASVEILSEGGVAVSFPCPGACAGLSPVVAETEQDALDPEGSGGDVFDIGDVGVASGTAFPEVRLTDVPGDGRTFDLDAIAVLNSFEPTRPASTLSGATRASSE